MIRLDDAGLSHVAKALRQYDLRQTAARIAGLLTFPALAANTIRIETLEHLAVGHCRGVHSPSLPRIRYWLNNQLAHPQLASLEDPVEDVFVTNVETPEGNYRLVGSIWEAGAYSVQVILDVLRAPSAPQECGALLLPILALLRLSECAAERTGLARWTTDESVPKGQMSLPPEDQVAKHALSVTFGDADLADLGIDRETLKVFILRDEDREVLRADEVGHSTLERRPLVSCGGELILSLPHGVSAAIRRFVLSELRECGHLKAFADALGSLQASQVVNDVFKALPCEVKSLELATLEDPLPNMHTWLLRYDIDKYIHVVLLHDNLDALEQEGLSSFQRYPRDLEVGLGRHLSSTAERCRADVGFREGITLLVIGGLGRGVALGLDGVAEHWSLSHIRLSDLYLMSRGLDRSVELYLKFAGQKRRVEEQGVRFMGIDGDFDSYCYWRSHHGQLVPYDVPMAPKSGIWTIAGMALPIREELRRSVDPHVVPTVAGEQCAVMRFGRDALFRSMQDRPIYASLPHLRSGILAGAVETQRGPSWLVVLASQDCDERTKQLLYETWAGFIGLFDRLVFEAEALGLGAASGAIEVVLNCSKVVVPEDHTDPLPNWAAQDLVVQVDHARRSAEVAFPPDFLKCFQQPANTGERLVMRGIAKALLGLHGQATNTLDIAVLDELEKKVIGASGMRVLHVFRAHHPVEQLLSEGQKGMELLAEEDLAFARLKLSEGCTNAQIGGDIEAKDESCAFLNRVVDKLWCQLRSHLRELDRAAVIREALRICERTLEDREHWQRTAQAILALYSPAEDVVAAARARESERTAVALPARTILEMAICECPGSGGRALSKWDMDSILATAALLIEVAMDSDAVYRDLIPPRIELCPNGDYTIDRSFYDTVMRPFVSAELEEQFLDAARGYDALYRHSDQGEPQRAESVFSGHFLRAFEAEFALTLDEVGAGVAELLDMAVERGTAVVDTTTGEIRRRLSGRGLTAAACQAFIQAFSIVHRPAWDKPPVGFEEKEIFPWRFRRRLSTAAKPILLFGLEDGDRAFFGAGAARSGPWYILSRAERGHLPQGFFTTEDMKSYIGTVSNERGHEFACSVADQLGQEGWKTRIEVEMTELGAPAELGDVDVLAWHPDGAIQIIECKRLQSARTVAEVAEVCQRFRGEARDELAKHVRRVTWIRGNPRCLQSIVKHVPEAGDIDDRLVTNVGVPMMYLTSLPVAPSKIGPLGRGSDRADHDS